MLHSITSLSSCRTRSLSLERNLTGEALLQRSRSNTPTRQGLHNTLSPLPALSVNSQSTGFLLSAAPVLSSPSTKRSLCKSACLICSLLYVHFIQYNMLLQFLYPSIAYFYSLSLWSLYQLLFLLSLYSSPFILYLYSSCSVSCFSSPLSSILTSCWDGVIVSLWEKRTSPWNQAVSPVDG